MEMIPLASSHTGGLNNAEETKTSKDNKTNATSSTTAKATSDKGGRPTKSSEELSDSGQKNRDSDSNALKGGEK